MRTPFAPEHQALRDSVRRLAEDALADAAATAEGGALPHAAAAQQCGDLGLFGLDDVLAEVAACEELGRVRSGGLVFVLLDTMLAADLGLDVTDGLVAVARGVRLRPANGGVDGDIPFLVGGLVAARCVVVDSGVLVRCGGPGWAAQPVADAHAFRGGAVAAVQLQGVAAEPLTVPPHVLARAELREAAAAVGAASRSFDDAAAYAQQREAFGRPIARFQVNRHGLAETATHLQAAQALVYDTAWRWSTGDRADPAAARLYAGQVALAAADRALQLHGGYGYTTAFDAQRAWRDARALHIGAGALHRRLEHPRGSVA